MRDVQYEEGFTFVTATIPTRSLEIFAPFLAVPEPVLVAEAVPAADQQSPTLPT